MNKRDFTKSVLNLAIGFSVGRVIGNVVTHTLPPTAGTFTKVTTKVGGFALSNVLAGMIAQKASNAIDDTIDKVETAKHEITEVTNRLKNP